MVKSKSFKTLTSRNKYIMEQKKAGKTSIEIGDEVGLSPSQVNRIIMAYKQNGRLQRKRGSGRQPVLTKAQKLKLCRLVEKYPEMSAATLAAECKINCSPQTIRNYLKSIGYSYKKTESQPYLTVQDYKERLFFAQSYRDYDFTTTIFVDESIFQVGQSYYCWSKIGEPLESLKGSFLPKVSVWASISTLGKLSLTFYEGSLDQFDYQRILRYNLYRQANRIWGQGVWVMLQDGASCHTAQSTIDSISQHAGDIVDWPASSPDLNPIENIWSILKDKVARRNPQTKEELKLCIRQEWNNLDNQEVISIAESMPKRVRMLIESEGEYTGY